jgi:hypothetical protein
MKKPAAAVRWRKIGTGGILLLAVGAILLMAQVQQNGKTQIPLGYRSAIILTVNGLQFKDLNRDGKLDRYEDWQLPAEARAPGSSPTNDIGGNSGSARAWHATDCRG